MAQKPDAPFLAAGTSRGLFVRSAEATIAERAGRRRRRREGAGGALHRGRAVARFGFTADRAGPLPARLRCAPSSGSPRRTTSTPSASLADEYIRNFMQQEPIPGIAYENGAGPALPAGDHARRGQQPRQRLDARSQPRRRRQRAAEGRRDRARRGEAGAVIKRRPAARADRVRRRGQRRAAARAAADAGPRRRRPSAKAAFGITEWTLSNGVRVVLKPTTFKQDEILFRAFSPGGTSLARRPGLHRRRDRQPGRRRRAASARSTRIDLGKKLAGKTAFGARRHRRDVRGAAAAGASRSDLETMFQLIYLTFTQPRADAEAFRAMTAQLTRGAGQPRGAARGGVQRRAQRGAEPEPSARAAADPRARRRR